MCSAACCRWCGARSTFVSSVALPSTMAELLTLSSTARTRFAFTVKIFRCLFHHRLASTGTNTRPARMVSSASSRSSRGCVKFCSCVNAIRRSQCPSYPSPTPTPSEPTPCNSGGRGLASANTRVVGGNMFIEVYGALCPLPPVLTLSAGSRTEVAYVRTDRSDCGIADHESAMRSCNANSRLSYFTYSVQPL